MHRKKQFLSVTLMLCLMIASLQAQSYQISFTGSGLSTTVDSVQVLNIAHGTSVIVKSTEDLHLVGTTTDIVTPISEKGYFRIFPNPMTETSEIEFFNSGESPERIEVFDLTCKMVIHNKQSLIQGNHRFEISGLNPGIYMINLFTGDGKCTGKLLSNAEHSGPPAIRYQGIINSSSQKSVLKSIKNLVQMPYNHGERLLLKGFSGNYSRVLTLIPTQNQTVKF